MMQTSRTLWTTAAVVVALGAGFGLAKLTDRPAPAAKEEVEEAEANAGGSVKLTPAQAAAAGIAVVSVGHGGGADLRLSGRVEPAPGARAVVAAPVGGSVERVLVAPGTQVGAGAVLAALRSPEAATVRAEVASADASSVAAAAALAREERLMKAGVTPRQDWEAARATAAKASAEAVAARARSGAYGSPGASGQLLVRSPIAGLVTSVQVSPGAYVAQGGPVAEVSDPARVEVVFTAPADAVSRLKAGLPLKVISPDGSETDAVILGIAPLAQGGTGAATVRARPTGGSRLAPGAAVSASIPTGGAAGLSVPAEAVQTLGGRTVVFVVQADGFRAQPVTPGRSGGGYTQIVSGLRGDERIAGRGAFLLKAELTKDEGGEEE